MIKNDVEEFELEQSGARIRIKRASKHQPGGALGSPTITLTTAPAAAAAPAVSAAEAASAPPAAAADDGLLRVTSPLVGTFYSRPNPSAPPFAEAGGRIEKGKTICIVEAMKVMNEIPAPATGEVVAVQVQDGEPVEFGEVLFLVRPE
jgi:acetyl-CoA carboxylase biotin carboxyl carrier protein